MKKKIVVLCAVAALLAITIAGGSLAWLMDEDKATNVFTIGSVEIVQNEQQYAEDGETLEDFEQDKVLLPIVNTEDPAADENYQDKIVTVTNEGKTPAYVQTFVAVPQVLDENGVLVIDRDATHGWTVTKLTETATIDGMAHSIYKFVLDGTLEADTTTQSLMDGVYINANVDMDVTARDADGNATEAVFQVPDANGDYVDVDGFNAVSPVNVYVATQAIQSQGFADAAEALANFDAHPWAA